MSGAMVGDALVRACTVTEALGPTRWIMGPNFNRQHSKIEPIDGGMQLDFIRAGKPVENAFIESFNGGLRDECLNVHQFASLAEAQAIIEAWRIQSPPPA